MFCIFKNQSTKERKMTEITTENNDTTLDLLEKLADHFAQSSISASTRKAYETDWLHFLGFCQQHNLCDLPAEPETVILYLSSMAQSKLSVSTIARRCTSITTIHRASGHDSPIKTDKVSRVFKGIKRKLGKPPQKRKALSWSDIKKIRGLCDSTIIGLRDAAIITLGWASALRRSELVSLDVEDLDISENGIILTVRKSKTDQEGSGSKIGIPRSNDANCPVATVERWLARRSKYELEGESPLFVKIGASGRGRWWCGEPCGRLSDRMVSNIVKHYVAMAGLPAKQYSSHSLRRGLATEAGAAGVPERVISRHTRHKSVEVLRGYIEDGTIWHDNPLPAIYGSSSCASSSLD